MKFAKYRNDLIRGKQAELDLSNADLATKSGLTEHTVIAIRKRRPVTTASLERVAETLGLPMSEVYRDWPPDTELNLN